MTSLKEWFGPVWPPEPPTRPGVGAAPGFRPPRTPAEMRAEETTRVAREMTDAQAAVRHAKMAQLREARLAREAEAEAMAKAVPPPKRARRG